MNYIANSKNRKLKNKIHTVVNRLSFNFLHLSSAEKVIGVGAAISLASLFFPWFSMVDGANYSAFNLMVGYTGYIILLILTILIFSLVSEQNKERMKARIHVGLSDYALAIFIGIVIFLLTFVVFNVVRGFVFFSQGFSVRNGVIFEWVGAIFIIFGGILLRREKKLELLKTMYVENNQSSTSILDEYDEILKKNESQKKNMSLPI